MSPPHLYIFHPSQGKFPGILHWLSSVEAYLRSEPEWDSCVLSRIEYDGQSAFDYSTYSDTVRRNRGPCIFIQRVQAYSHSKFCAIVDNIVSIYSISPSCEEDVIDACIRAGKAFDAGEPLMPLRELIAYLIIAKLVRKDRWGGTALNKSFLWSSLLPKGGFPKPECDDREIMNVANHLKNCGILTGKTSEGKLKLALGDKMIIERIMASKSFVSLPHLQSYFAKSQRLVSVALRDRKYSDDE